MRKLDPHFIAQSNQLPAMLEKVLQDGDVLLMQGAGNIGAIAAKLAASQLRDIA